MKNFAQFRPNTLLFYPRRNCLRLEFFDHFVFCIFSNFELKCLEFAPEIRSESHWFFEQIFSRMLVKNAFKVFRKMFWLQLFYKGKLLSFFLATLAEKILDFDKKILAVLSKYTSTFAQELFEDGVLWIFFVFYIFLIFELKCSDFAHRISTSLLTLLSNSLQGCFDDNLFQERDNLLFILGLSPNFFWVFGRVAKIAFSVARWKLHATKFFPERKYFL